ncbi:hypothetical protein JCM1841_006070 [Sporobolomyces salmonicolor]
MPPILPAFPFEAHSHSSLVELYTSFLELTFSDDEPLGLSLIDVEDVERRLFFSPLEERAEYGSREPDLCEKIAGQFEKRIEGSPAFESELMRDFWESIK